ncbi:STAS domain-containing protein [Amycolatopsis sp. NPDC004378]
MITRLAGPDEMTITASGAIDVINISMLDDEFVRAMTLRPSAIVVDLDGVTFCDSTGFSSLAKLNSGCSTSEITSTIAEDNPERR